ncbi:hypothetical protein C6501_19665 [Candidatus Poribacteria bacterium]|nr:MAG: hypothetical protein C6501_19665 [Candidatus Poribacteria bacterium]
MEWIFGQIIANVLSKIKKVDGVMRIYQFLALFLGIFILGLVLNISGCGGSNMKNPVSDTDVVEDDVEEAGELDVTVTVTKEVVEPGEQVELTASVNGVRGTSVVLNWLNITGYGTLSATNDYTVTWTAPDALGEANTRVEVLQLVVTVISEVVSVGASGIQTDTQIFSDITKILLKVTRE